ncbi:MAG: S8 family serine peptidase [Planctomycetota bacterium]
MPGLSVRPVPPLRRPARVALSVLAAGLLGAPLLAQDARPALADPAGRRAIVDELAREWAESRARVANEFARFGGPISGITEDGRQWEIIDVLDGRPIAFVTHNANAAISTGANLVRQQATYAFADGASQIVGVWDGGRARETHQEFGGRAVPSDTAGIASHATHVTGTIAASGVDGSAKGMAPAVTVRNFGWGSDTSEAAANAAATIAQQTTTVTISNHSYGILSGWEWGSWSGTTGWHWWGAAGAQEDSSYGGYGSTARTWDIVSYNAPYYLAFRSAGNDRLEGPPSVGETWYQSSGGWQALTYDPALHPFEDGNAAGVTGMDCIGQAATAKNIVTVGAATDAVSGGVRSWSSTSLASFSGRGPMDDGRIKPDLVANGVSLYSTGSSSDTNYYNSSGTSMSSPNAAGSAALIRDLWEKRLPGTSFRASTLKGLLLHTAHDLGNPGPDYSWGWGYLDAKAAADQIEAHVANPIAELIAEETLSIGSPSLSAPITADSGAPLVVTICWTDPAGQTKSGVDNPQPDLVNDLDLRLVRDSDGAVFEPWILDPNAPTANATKGDNVVDNVEQVFITAPSAGETYSLQVTHKGSLTNGSQVFSMILSGGYRGNWIQASAVELGQGCGGVFIPYPNIFGPGPVLGETFTVQGVGAPPGVFGLVAASVGSVAPTPLPDGCMLWIDAATAFQTDSPYTGLFGQWSSSTFIPDLAWLEGLVFRVQAIFPGAPNGWGWALTSGLECTIGH